MRYDDAGNILSVYGPNAGRPLNHLDDQPAPVGTSRRTTINAPVGTTVPKD